MLLEPHERPAAEVINPEGRSPVVLVCEHASNAIPEALAGLGLDSDARQSHVAWDLGALDLARMLSLRMDAPLVISTVSRLVYDCNRPPHAPGAMPQKSELIEVPGNRSLTGAQRQQRIAEVYEPFCALLKNVLDQNTARTPALVTVHSFTPVYFGEQRTVELGLLHDRDDRLARSMLNGSDVTGLRTELNAPYSALDGVMHTLTEHALQRGWLNVMLEVRNDLLALPGAPDRYADALSVLLAKGLQACEEDALKGLTV